MHPKYRTIGLGVKLVKENLGLVGTEFIEMPAVMAKYNLFAEKARMTKICEQRPSKEAMNIAEVLSSLGFNLQFLSSHSYVLSILSRLEREITQIKRASKATNGHEEIASLLEVAFEYVCQKDNFLYFRKRK
jgi:hypothetical protein